MGHRLGLIAGAAATIGLASSPAPLAAQAFTPVKGVGSLTLAGQRVDNTGHRLTDGFLLEGHDSITASVLLEGEYAFTDRLSAGVAIPYVFAKYSGVNPPLSGLPHDECRCWQSSFQDVSVSARYRFGGESWALTPVFRYNRPSHSYRYVGEAVVGRNLQEAQLGVFAGARLGFLPRTTLQTGYIYAFVESPLDDVSLDRSNGFVDLGHAVNRRLYVRAAGIWQHTHGGLRAGSQTGVPFPFPGELGPFGSERYAQRDRVQKTHYWQLGGGVSYSLGPLDVFMSYSNYVWGRDAHEGTVWGAGATWYFRLPD